MIECQACMAGTYANSSGVSECTLCEPGKTTDHLNAMKCDVCAEGKAQPKTGSSSEHCPDCKVGFFADKQGLAECQSCGISHYNDLEGQRECLPCLEFGVRFGFDRPDQCGVIWMIFGSLVGCIVLTCLFCCWAKLGFPCCCGCLKSKSKKISFKKRNTREKASTSRRNLGDRSDSVVDVSDIVKEKKEVERKLRMIESSLEMAKRKEEIVTWGPVNPSFRDANAGCYGA